MGTEGGNGRVTVEEMCVVARDGRAELGRCVEGEFCVTVDKRPRPVLVLMRGFQLKEVEAAGAGVVDGKAKDLGRLKCLEQSGVRKLA